MRWRIRESLSRDRGLKGVMTRRREERVKKTQWNENKRDRKEGVR